MKSCTFRLSESDIDLLKQIAEIRNEKQSDAIRYAIRLANKEVHTKGGEDVCDKDSNLENQIASIAIESLNEQLSVKDEQIKQLLNQNAELQKLIDQEQRLHLATKAESPLLLEEKNKQGKKSFWQRLFG